MNINNYVSALNQSGARSVSQSRPSLLSALDDVKYQVEFEAFGRLMTTRDGSRVVYVDPIFQELCLIIAEVFVMHPDCVIKVAKTDLCSSLVYEVFKQLTNEHLQMVYDNFKAVQTKIHNKKSYLRTALYNAVFEHNAHYTNALQADYHS